MMRSRRSMVNRLARLWVAVIAAGGLALSVPAAAYADSPAGYGACVVHDAYTNLPPAPATGQSAAGRGYASRRSSTPATTLRPSPPAPTPSTRT
jgi:hypothetical protein